jgi:hypothetical protein
VNAQGGCSTGKVVLPHDKQQRLLELEGVVFNQSGRCDLEKFLFIPKVKSPSASLYKRSHKKAQNSSHKKAQK